jgi:hypothetical protein
MNWIMLPFASMTVLSVSNNLLLSQCSYFYVCQDDFVGNDFCGQPGGQLECTTRVFCGALTCGGGNFYPCGKT